MRIQHNIPAMNAYRNYNANTKALQANLQKLSSGYKINKAGDDAAGLAISEKMRAQITGLEVAQKNAKDGISLVQTAEGAMTEIHTMLNRMFSLAEQSANGTYADEVDREQLNNEFVKLTKEIDRIADSTNFNGKKLLNGDLDGVDPTDAPAGGGGEDAVTAVTGTLDGTANAANLGANTKFEIDANATADQKTAFNTAMDGKKITATYAHVGGTSGTSVGNNDTITLSGDGWNALKAGNYTVEFTAQDGTTGVAVPTSGATDGQIKLITAGATGPAATAGALALTIKDDQGATVGTLTLDVQAASTDGASDIKFAEPATMIDNAELEAGGNKDLTTDYGIEKIDFGTTEVAEGADVKVGFGATTDVLTVEVGGTTFSSAALTGSGYTGDVELDDGNGNKITVTLAAGQTKLADNATIAPDTVGTTKAAKGETKPAALRLRVGDSTNTYDDIYVKIKSLNKDKLSGEIKEGREDLIGTTKTLDQLDVLNQDNADIAMGVLKDMINYVSTERGELGATQNRLDHTINNLSTMQENIQDAEATIRDVDVAEEMMKYTKNNILVQSAQAMLAQANQLPQGVLQLLG